MREVAFFGGSFSLFELKELARFPCLFKVRGKREKKGPSPFFRIHLRLLISGLISRKPLGVMP